MRRYSRTGEKPVKKRSYSDGPVSQQTNQIGQGRDRVILQVTQRFGIAAQEPIYLRGPERTGRQWRAATAPDPGHLEAEMFGAGDVESVRQTNSTSSFFKPSVFSTSA